METEKFFQPLVNQRSCDQKSHLIDKIPVISNETSYSLLLDFKMLKLG